MDLEQFQRMKRQLAAREAMRPASGLTENSLGRLSGYYQQMDSAPTVEQVPIEYGNPLVPTPPPNQNELFSLMQMIDGKPQYSDVLQSSPQQQALYNRGAMAAVNALPTQTSTPSTPSALDTAPPTQAPVQATGGVPQEQSVTKLRSIADQITDAQGQLSGKIQEANRVRPLSYQEAIGDALTTLLPSLIASSLVDTGKYGDVLAQSTAENFDAVTANREAMLKGERDAASDEAKQLSQQITQLNTQQNNQIRQEQQAEVYGNDILDANEAAMEANAAGMPEMASQWVGQRRRAVKDMIMNRSRNRAEDRRNKQFEQSEGEREVWFIDPAPGQGKITYRPGEAEKLRKEGGAFAGLMQNYDELQKLMGPNGEMDVTGPNAAAAISRVAAAFAQLREVQGTGANLTGNEKALITELLPAAPNLRSLSDLTDYLIRRATGTQSIQVMEGLKRLAEERMYSRAAGVGGIPNLGKLLDVNRQNFNSASSGGGAPTFQNLRSR